MAIKINNSFGGTSSYDELSNKPITNGAVTSYQSDIAKKQIRNITFSTTDPTSSDGVNGDVWIVYE